MLETIKGLGAVVATLKPEGEGWQVIARLGPHEVILAVRADKAQARKIARAAVTLGELPAFSNWIAEGAGGKAERVF